MEIGKQIKALRQAKNVKQEEPDHVQANSYMAYLYNHRAHSDHEVASGYAKKVLELAPGEKRG